MILTKLAILNLASALEETDIDLDAELELLEMSSSRPCLIIEPPDKMLIMDDVNLWHPKLIKYEHGY